MSKRREYDDDDGRRIADMSGVDRMPLYGVGSRRTSKQKEEDPSASQPAPEKAQPMMPKSDRRAFVWGALSAALLIGLAFIVGLGLVVLLFVLLK